LALLIVDAFTGVGQADVDILAELPNKIQIIMVLNKIDILGVQPKEVVGPERTEIWLSAKLGEGVNLLRAAILRCIGWQSTAEGTFVAREGHLQALREAAMFLNRAALQADSLELLAEELRLAQQVFTDLTGKFTADDLLGEIFSRFCIGK
jgi:tRNA modification GTPase